MSAKIQFKSGKTKTKVFEQVKKDLDNTDTSVLFDNKTSVLVRLAKEEPKEKTKKPSYKTVADVFRSLSEKLTMHYNIESVTVYQRTEKNSDGKIHFKRLFGAEISKYEIEKYFGYTSPVILTNAEGFTDNSSHRSRLIERYNNDYLIVISGSSYEVFRSEYDLAKIRYDIAEAFKEVERL